jgi:protein-tyrosine-phosphatase/DNA-binding transcriptional ArsR family regulator
VDTARRFDDIDARAAVHAALGEPHRLAIVDELLLSDRAPSELRVSTAMESNLLAHHLDVLERAGVIERVTSSGDHRRRYLRLIHAALESLPGAPLPPVQTVLFVCTENSARSQLAAAIWNASAPGHADSAGTQPAKHVHPLAITTAARHGLDLSRARPRRLSDVVERPDVIVTVCDRAHEELTDAQRSRTLHWSIPDPAMVGTVAAFARAYQTLEQRIEAAAPVLMGG